MIQRIVKRFRPERIILFGSYAYGVPHADSDVDILVVMPARNEIDHPHRNCRIGQSQQLERPIAERKDRRPRPRDPSHQRRMLRIAPFDAAPHRPGFQHVGVQIAADISDAEIDQPDGDKSDQQTRDDPSRFGLRIGQPAQKRPSPARRASFHIGGRYRVRTIRKTHWHKPDYKLHVCSRQTSTGPPSALRAEVS